MAIIDTFSLQHIGKVSVSVLRTLVGGGGGEVVDQAESIRAFL